MDTSSTGKSLNKMFKKVITSKNTQKLNLMHATSVFSYNIHYLVNVLQGQLHLTYSIHWLNSDNLHYHVSTILSGCVTSGFHHEVDENCALLGYYAMSSGNFLSTVWDNLSIPSSKVKNIKKKILTLKDGNNMLSWNVSTELPLLAA
jgi:hypothetical protein